MATVFLGACSEAISDSEQRHGPDRMAHRRRREAGNQRLKSSPDEGRFKVPTWGRAGWRRILLPSLAWRNVVLTSWSLKSQDPCSPSPGHSGPGDRINPCWAVLRSVQRPPCMSPPPAEAFPRCAPGSLGVVRGCRMHGGGRATKCTGLWQRK